MSAGIWAREGAKEQKPVIITKCTRWCPFPKKFPFHTYANMVAVQAKEKKNMIRTRKFLLAHHERICMKLHECNHLFGMHGRHHALPSSSAPPLRFLPFFYSQQHGQPVLFCQGPLPHSNCLQEHNAQILNPITKKLYHSGVKTSLLQSCDV